MIETQNSVCQNHSTLQLTRRNVIRIVNIVADFAQVRQSLTVETDSAYLISVILKCNTKYWEELVPIMKLGLLCQFKLMLKLHMKNADRSAQKMTNARHFGIMTILATTVTFILANMSMVRILIMLTIAGSRFNVSTIRK